MTMLSNFTQVCSTRIRLHADIPDANLRFIHGRHYRTLYVANAAELPRSGGNHFTMLLDIPKTVFIEQILRLSWYSQDDFVYPYLDERTESDFVTDEMNQYYQSYRVYKKASVILRLMKVEGEYFVTYWVRDSVLNAVEKVERTYRMNTLVDLFLSQVKNEITSECENKLKGLLVPVSEPRRSDACHSTGILKQGVELFDYQKRDVAWMQTIEDKIASNDNVISYDYSYAEPMLDNRFVMVNDTLFPKWIMDTNSTSGNCIDSFRIHREFKYFGGNIVSEVGLGKTVVSLYHILASSADDRVRFNHFVRPVSSCNYMYKRGANKGMPCGGVLADPDSMYCKKHTSALFMEKRLMEYVNLEDFRLSDFLESSLLRTNASLVLSPSHLSDQWVREFYEKFENDKRVVLVLTQDHYNNLTVGDLLFADIVVMSYQFVSGYYKRTRTALPTNCETRGLLGKRMPMLEWFKWRAVYLDEAHEIQKDMVKGWRVRNVLSRVKSRYRWNVTGTPFANGMDGFLSLLSYNTTWEHTQFVGLPLKKVLSSPVRPPLVDHFQHLFRCNTKESVKDEYSGNVVDEHVHSLTFTPQERNVYDSYLAGHGNRYDDFLVQLCCHIDLFSETKSLMQNCKTLEDIQETMLSFTEEKKKAAEAGIRRSEATLRRLEEAQQDTETTDEVKAAIANERRRLTNLKKECGNLNRTFTFLKNAIESVETVTCPVCLDTIDEENMSITKCGHKFCWSCITRVHSVMQNRATNTFACPTCKTGLGHTDVFKLDRGGTLDTGDASLDKLIQMVRSTKIGNIIHFLRNGTSEKVIIFSQWDELLRKVGDVLAQQGLSIVYCSGSVFQRKRAIGSFCKDPSVNVIMLSSKNAASGINLTVANNIVFLEPVYGTEDYRRSIEEQAIGRSDRIGQNKKIQVHRFVIKDTIEEEIINSTRGT